MRASCHGHALRTLIQSCNFAAGAPERTSRRTFALKTCKFRAGAAAAHFVHHFCAEKLQFSNFKLELRECTSSTTLVLKIAICKPELWSALRVLVLYLKLASSPQTTFVPRSARSCEISAEGSPSSRQIRTAPKRERFHTHDLRKGFAECKTHSHAQSPQRVRRALARRHSESASTRTISAQGSPSSRQIRTAPQRDRFHTHDLRKGFTFVLQRLQMSETLRLPRNSQTLFTKMLRLPRILLHQRRMLRWPQNSAATHKSEDRRGATARAQF